MKLRDIPLGGLFKYSGADDVYVLLRRPGFLDRGECAEAFPASVRMQGVYSITEEDNQELEVEEVQRENIEVKK